MIIWEFEEQTEFWKHLRNTFTEKEIDEFSNKELELLFDIWEMNNEEMKEWKSHKKNMK